MESGLRTPGLGLAAALPGPWPAEPLFPGREGDAAVLTGEASNVCFCFCFCKAHKHEMSSSCFDAVCINSVKKSLILCSKKWSVQMELLP